jgi:tRNA-dihydrouridine synthase A
MLGLFGGLPGARAWKQHLSENAPRRGVGHEVLQAAARVSHEAEAPLARAD